MVNAREVIAQALALSGAATDGPWDIEDGQIINYPTLVCCPNDPVWVADVGHHTANAEFIAAARTLLPALARALGDVLALVETGDRFDGYSDPVGDVTTHDLRAAITAALSEVTP